MADIAQSRNTFGHDSTLESEAAGAAMQQEESTSGAGYPDDADQSAAYASNPTKPKERISTATLLKRTEADEPHSCDSDLDPDLSEADEPHSCDSDLDPDLSEADQPIDTAIVPDPELAQADEPISVLTVPVYGLLEDDDCHFYTKEAPVKQRNNREEQIEENKKVGDHLQNFCLELLKKEYKNAVSEVSISAFQANGEITRMKVRVDAIFKDKEGKIFIHEYKSSKTAPLTVNQKLLLPYIVKYGGVVRGKGKGIFAGEYCIPPTAVKIIRPGEAVKYVSPAEAPLPSLSPPSSNATLRRETAGNITVLPNCPPGEDKPLTVTGRDATVRAYLVAMNDDGTATVVHFRDPNATTTETPQQRQKYELIQTYGGTIKGEGKGAFTEGVRVNPEPTQDNQRG